MKTSKAFIFSLGIALTLSLGTTAVCAQDASQANQPSVAEAARKARAERKEAPKTAKVFTNEDVSSLKGSISVVGETPEAPSADAAKTAAAPGTSGGKDESYFRGKFADARRALADDERELDVLQREFGLKQTQYYSDPNVAMREQNSREDLNKTQAEIDQKKADVAKDQQAISDLEDDLRKSGGEPGWENPAQGNTPPATAPQANAPQAATTPATAPPANAPQ